MTLTTLSCAAASVLHVSVFVSRSSPFLDSTCRYPSRGHFVVPHSSLLPAAISCVVVSLNSCLVFRVARAPVPRARLLPFTSAELSIIRSSEHLSSSVFRMHLTAPTAIWGNVTVTRGSASATEQMCENIIICFFSNFLVSVRGLSSIWVNTVLEFGIKSSYFKN